MDAEFMAFFKQQLNECFAVAFTSVLRMDGYSQVSTCRFQFFGEKMTDLSVTNGLLIQIEPESRLWYLPTIDDFLLAAAGNSTFQPLPVFFICLSGNRIDKPIFICRELLQ